MITTITHSGTATIILVDICGTTPSDNTVNIPSCWVEDPEPLVFMTPYEVNPYPTIDQDYYKLQMILWNRQMAQQISIRPENWIMPKSPIEKRRRKNNRISFAKRMININPMIFLIIILMTII